MGCSSVFRMKWLSLVALVTGCHLARPGRSLTASPEVCHAARPFCLSPREMETLLGEAPLYLRAAEPVGSGRAGAIRLLVEIPPVVRVKWKSSAPGGDGYNRSPRRELAAYALQKLLLDEDDYVVPPSAARCQPPEWAALAGSDATPTFADARCVLGVVSYWVEDAHPLEPFSQDRFAHDGVYRRRVALLNLVTHLIDHHDTKAANFVVSRDQRAFSVDNGMAFSGWRTPYGWFSLGWQDLRVGALPADVVRRLRRLTRRDLDSLATVAELRVRAGRLEPAALEPPFDAARGVRRRGDRIQLGLTVDEIDSVWQRLEGVIEKLDRGEVRTF
jgi:hypothetical protein